MLQPRLGRDCHSTKGKTKACKEKKHLWNITPWRINNNVLISAFVIMSYDYFNALSQDLLWVVVTVPVFHGIKGLVNKNTNWAGLQGPVIPSIILRGWAIMTVQTWNIGSLSNFLCDRNYFWSKPTPRINSNYTAAFMDYVKQSGNGSCRVFVLILAQIGSTFDSKSQVQLKFKDCSINGDFPKWISCQARPQWICTSKKLSLSATVVTFFNRSSLCSKTMFP